MRRVSMAFRTAAEDLLETIESELAGLPRIRLSVPPGLGCEILSLCASVSGHSVVVDANSAYRLPRIFRD